MRVTTILLGFTLHQLVLANQNPCFDFGMDYWGNNLLPDGIYKSTPTAEKCQEKCQNTNGCNYWTWDKSWNNACWMKTSLTKKNYNPRLISGPRSCGSSPSPPSRSTKRGVAIDPKQFRCEDLMAFTGIGWYYSWGTRDPIRSCNGVHVSSEFVPMIWGRRPNLPLLEGYDVVLGFNEPNHHNQANMSPRVAAREWMKLLRAYPDKILVSPSPAPGGYVDTFQWFDQFFAVCKQLGCRVDYLATHAYSGNAAYDKKFLLKLYQRYGRKIWFTEFAAPSTRDPRVEKEYMKQMLPFLEESDAIWRYSWFVHRFSKVGSGHGWYLDKAISLMKQHSSELTELGEFYNNY